MGTSPVAGIAISALIVCVGIFMTTGSGSTSGIGWMLVVVGALGIIANVLIRRSRRP